jgi:hypothetical protein
MNPEITQFDIIQSKLLQQLKKTTKKQMPKYIKVYTDIDPTVEFVFPVNKIDHENSEKLVSQDKFEVNQMRIQKL